MGWRVSPKYGGGVTEIPIDEGEFIWAVLDPYSRRCVGFATGAHHDAELARPRCGWPSLFAAVASAAWSSIPIRAANTPAASSCRHP